ncbi:MAG: YbaB/EbfC family nucleoid-associated protein [Bacillota bacterium]
MGKMLKQVQKMQNQMLKMQEELNDRTVEAASGGGAVRCVVSGGRELRELVIDPDLLRENDVEMLQDLIMAAVNEALRAAEKMVNDEMGKITGGMGLPPGMF